MVIADVITAYPQILPVFEEKGIHCVGCSFSSIESIQEGAAVHGLDPKKLCLELNKALKKSKKT
ncbi:DUF1858 domain-containing protein [Patescibacteria group bacterium]|nr:DUF1858 domain-containing protein [Patescibacteria group bacterium]MBU1702859.1 DUF1858 domain-containing protein [Patescibacteria group bacterium]MBU1953898.1 DUF1858 domain-containing protein [Patescibacteria group bacterium]